MESTGTAATGKCGQRVTTTKSPADAPPTGAWFPRCLPPPVPTACGRCGRCRRFRCLAPTAGRRTLLPHPGGGQDVGREDGRRWEKTETRRGNTAVAQLRSLSSTQLRSLSCTQLCSLSASVFSPIFTPHILWPTATTRPRTTRTAGAGETVAAGSSYTSRSPSRVSPTATEASVEKEGGVNRRQPGGGGGGASATRARRHCRRSRHRCRPRPLPMATGR